MRMRSRRCAADCGTQFAAERMVWKTLTMEPTNPPQICSFHLQRAGDALYSIPSFLIRYRSARKLIPKSFAAAVLL